MVDNKNANALSDMNDTAEWSFKIGHIPETPKVKFIDQISWASVSRILDAMGIAVHTPDVHAALSDTHCPVEISLDGLADDAHEMTKRLCERLAIMGISHHGYFQVGGVWMIQSVEFNNPRASNGIICWPAGMTFTAADAAYIILGTPVEGKQDILDRVFAAGGYISVDLELLGVRGGIVPNVSCGTKPGFARYKTHQKINAHQSADDFNLSAFAHAVQPHNATQH